LSKLICCLVLLAALICTEYGLCSPTGLNVIPTADVLEKDTYRLDTPFSGGMRFGPDGDMYVLLQVGAGNGMEVGIDQRVDNGYSESWLNAKWRIMEEDGIRPALAIGVQNISRKHEEEPYLVVSKSLKPARFHLGVMRVSGESQAMLGLDRRLGPSLAMQADYVSGRENGFSAGIGIEITKNATLLVARSFPTDPSRDAEYMLKFGMSTRF